VDCEGISGTTSPAWTSTDVRGGRCGHADPAGFHNTIAALTVRMQLPGLAHPLLG